MIKNVAKSEERNLQKPQRGGGKCEDQNTRLQYNA